MEELTLVEINSMAGKSVVPMETFLKAIRMFNMAKRAEEEESLLNEELSNVADFYTKEHLLLQSFIATAEGHTAYQRGCLNLLHHRLLLNEVPLKSLSSCTSVYQNFKLPIVEFSHLDMEDYYSTEEGCTSDSFKNCEDEEGCTLDSDNNSSDDSDNTDIEFM